MIVGTTMGGGPQALNLGLYPLASATTGMVNYNYTEMSSATTASLTGDFNAGTACGTTSTAYFCLGDGTTATNTTPYSAVGPIAGPVALYDVGTSGYMGAATGNLAQMFVGVGADVTSSINWTYSGNSQSAGPAFPAAEENMVSAGTGGAGYFVGVSPVDFYEFSYSGQAFTAGPALTTNDPNACGNLSVGVFNDGGGAATVVLTYSGFTSAAGGNFTSSSTESGGAAGNATLGLFALGDGASTTNGYTFSNNSVAATNSLASAYSSTIPKAKACAACTPSAAA